MSKFVITIPTRNSEKYIKRSILSALNQEYDNFEIIIIDDESTDSSWNIISDTIQSHHNKTKIRSCIQNKKRIGVLANHYKMAQMCADDEIIVNLDGDDQLAHNDVLKILDKIYNTSEIWMTYGSFAYDYESRNPDPNSDPRGFVSQIPPNKHDRNYYFVSSHLRTYKKWLFSKIKLEDLKFKNDFYQLAMDHALMFPMIEMSGPDHAVYVHDILYMYNAVNVLNEHTLMGRDAVMQVADYIKSQPIYPRIKLKEEN